MHKKLEEIIKKTKEDLLKRKRNDRSFHQAMLNSRSRKVAIIAEIKLASPNEGILGDKDEIETRVKQYEQAGADAISVVTEKHFFKSSPLLIKKIKNTTSLSVLQKDFIVDPYQLYESKTAGADAILLIAKILSKEDLISLVNLAKSLNIEPVVEVNNQEDLKKAIETQTNIIAVNARDLDTFEVSVDKACELLKKIPDKFIKLGFSGIHSRVEVEKYKQAGAKAVLVGTELMKTNNVNKFIKELKMSVKVKVCGIRTKDAAKAAVDAGADFLGFNFVPTSKRYISPSDAEKIINLVKGKVKVVGVFQNADLSYVNKLALNLGLDFAQLHGNEDNDYINNVGIPVIKSIKIDDGISKMKARYVLLDRSKQGEGNMADLKKSAKLATNFPLFYAGGLNPDNVAEVIEKVKPFAVDVAGGVETKGVQDIEKIKLFIKNVTGVNI